MMQKPVLLLLLIFSGFFTLAQGYSIEVKLRNSPRKQLYLAYYYGDKTYIKDTVDVVNSIAVFKGSKPLEYGVYLVVEPADNKFVELLIDDKDQQFFVEVDFTKNPALTDIQGSVVNQDFMKYTAFIQSAKQENDSLAKKKTTQLTEAQKKSVEAAIDKLDKSVKKYQQEYVSSHPSSLLTLLIKAGNLPDPPVFTGTTDEVNRQNWRWYKTHWFDNINTADNRMVRTTIFANKVDYYIDKLTTQHPDSVIASVDEVIGKAKASAENYKYLVTSLLNKYARSTIVGMDAVYTHIALRYYGKQKPDWIEQEQLNKILENARRLEPLLIGKKAPDLNLRSRTGTPISLYEFSAKYTILFFYNTGSTACKKAIPALKAAAGEYAANGVKVLTICTNFTSAESPDEKSVNGKTLSAFIEEQGMNDFFNTCDIAGDKNAQSVYDVKTVPQVYLLDQDKIIRSKKIGTSQLKEVLAWLVKEHEYR